MYYITLIIDIRMLGKMIEVVRYIIVKGAKNLINLISILAFYSYLIK